MSASISGTAASGTAASGTAASEAGSAVSGGSTLRLTKRGRAVFTAAVALPLVIGAMVFALNGGSATASGAAGSVDYVTVDGGQSLWELAEELDPSGDTREVVAQLLKFNSLTTADVYAGQQLAVPAQYVS
ncbi:MAG: hypothetical protein JWP30_655 [Homoserinimonas sp.]|jgi:LysM repeat protein|nr:hypothetical protein [Homoserinimonas sp.]